MVAIPGALGLALAIARATAALAPAPDGRTAAAPLARAPESDTAVAVAPAGLAIGRVATAENVVALTFDACATRTRAYAVDWPTIEILERERIPATIFASGRWIEAHPDAARALAASPLFEIGNHSQDHARLPALRASAIAREIDRTQQIIAALGRKASLFRPPFGDFDRRLVRLAAARGLRTILWDVASGDAGGHLRAASIVKNVSRAARPGSIVVFHLNGRSEANRRGPAKTGRDRHTSTREALPGIITALRARGVRFVRVSDLLALPDATPVPALHGVRVPPRAWETAPSTGPARAHSPP